MEPISFQELRMLLAWGPHLVKHWRSSWLFLRVWLKDSDRREFFSFLTLPDFPSFPLPFSSSFRFFLCLYCSPPFWASFSKCFVNQSDKTLMTWYFPSSFLQAHIFTHREWIPETCKDLPNGTQWTMVSSLVAFSELSLMQSLQKNI